MPLFGTDSMISADSPSAALNGEAPDSDRVVPLVAWEPSQRSFPHESIILGIQGNLPGLTSIAWPWRNDIHPEMTS
jgi:hypothetical protein